MDECWKGHLFRRRSSFFFFFCSTFYLWPGRAAHYHQREISFSYMCVYIPLYGLYGYKRKKEKDVLDFRGVPHLSFLAWAALVYNLFPFLTQKKKKNLKNVWKKKNIKKNLEGAPSSLVVVGPDLFGAVCTVVVKISQSVKRKAYGCRNLPNFLFFLVLWLVDTFVPLKLCPPCRSFFFFVIPLLFHLHHKLTGGTLCRLRATSIMKLYTEETRVV